ncbi:MAG: hypothetical protein QM820_41420 [Minicystis sp.]
MSASDKTTRFVLVAAATLGAGIILPAACLFPDYTFDLHASGGAGGSMSTSSTGRGGAGVTSSSTAESSSSSSSSTSGSGGSGTGGMGTGGMGTGGEMTTSSSTASSTASSSSSGGTCTTVDCSDPNCQPTYACVAPAPTGWQGPFALYDGAPAGFMGCPNQFPVQAYGGNGQFSAQPASCSACNCAAPQNQVCTFGNVEVNDTACGTVDYCTGAQSVPSNWNGSCYYNMDGWIGGVKTCGPQTPGSMNCNTGTQDCNVSVRVDQLTVTGGTCAPTTQTPTVPPYTWGTLGGACGGAPAITKGCNATYQCLPKPQAPFQSGMCVQKGGVNACPPTAGSPFTKQHIFYGSASDTRTCSDCACGDPTGASCSATMTWYPTTNCSNTPVATLTVSTSAPGCQNLTNNPDVGSRKGVITGPTGGNCQASGGQPTGTATPQSPTTFCCIP